MHFSILAMSLYFFSLTHGAALQSRAFTGQATFYGGNLHGGACSFSTYTLPSGIHGTALSDSNWANSSSCGACVLVTGPGGQSVKAMIVDECPGCGTNHLDLFPDAFATLATPSTGVISVSWSFVDCAITSPLQLHIKDGASQYWFSMQVVNANGAVASLEVSTDGGATWTSTSRQSYNFFQHDSGFGPNAVDVKVTSTSGEAIIVKNVQVSSGASTTAASNFGSSGGGAGPNGPSPGEHTSSTAVEAPIPSPTPSSSTIEPLPLETEAPAVACQGPTSGEDTSPTTTETSSIAMDVSSTAIATTLLTIASAATTTTPVAAASVVTVYVYETCSPS